MVSKKDLLKQFHVVLQQTGSSKTKLLSQYNCTSSKDLTEEQLINLINQMNDSAHTWRRRLMGVIGAWLRKRNIQHDAIYIKKIACRACDASDFNAIPIAKMSAVYNRFCDANKAIVQTDKTIKELSLLTPNPN